MDTCDPGLYVQPATCNEGNPPQVIPMTSLPDTGGFLLEPALLLGSATALVVAGIVMALVAYYRSRRA